MESGTAVSVTPLDGIRVLDLTRLLPGAYATLLLADLGADVIKVEDPRGGDPIRSMAPLAESGSVYHHVLNRNKRSVTLDLRLPAARRVLEALLDGTDVVVESFRPQTARRLRVTAADLRAMHPRMVHCSITGFGQDGPYAERAGHDINYVALAGLLWTDRTSQDAAPRMPRMFLADIGGGAMSAVSGILAALFARERTGRGSAVDISMHEGALSWLSVPAARVLAGRTEGDPADLPITGREACYNVYRTSDGRFIALGALEEKFWTIFCQRVGHPEWIPQQYMGGDEQRRLLQDVTALLASRSRDEWMTMFADVDICLTPVHTVTEALQDPHVAARGVVSRDGDRSHVRPGIRVDSLDGGHEWPPLRAARKVGADTDEVLTAAGLTPSDLERLRADRVI